jgi:hypothetical protein
MSQRAVTIADRAIAYLYFYAVTKDAGASLQQIIADFRAAGLGAPNITKLRATVTRDKRTVKVSADAWRLRTDKLAEVEKNFALDHCLKMQVPLSAPTRGTYVDSIRLDGLKAKSTGFDLARLIQMLTELDHAFASANYISVILLVRAILDHVPPLFGLKTFNEVANNYKGTKSFKDSISHLENSSRKIADSYLHTTIRTKESLPTKTQVNFSNDLDVLLAEIVRIN